jgi:hypothetical protein
MTAYKDIIMKKILILLLLSMNFSSFAGPGHDHSHGHAAPVASTEKIQEIGRSHIERLIKAKTINISWKTSTYSKSEKKKFGNKVEWILTYENAKGVKGKKLYIFLKLSGEFVAVNFTGK